MIDDGVPRSCPRCHGDYGWLGLHGVWEPCPDCDPPAPISSGSRGDS